MRADIYVRVSTTAQGDDGSSLATQEAACREYIEARGWKLGDVYSDTQSGAAYRERPGLSALREHVRAGAVDVVLVYALDRLSRNQAHMVILAEEIEDHGARLECVTEDFEDSAVGRFIRSAKAFAAEVEREKIGERTVRGKRARLTSGKIHSHGSELYGYRRDKTEGKRTIYEPEASIVRQMYQWVAAERLSIRSVQRRLNESGIPSPSTGKIDYKAGGRFNQDGTGTHWGKTQVHRMLTNPAYKGETVVWTHRSHGNHKAVGVRPADEWLYLPDDVTPAIVTPALWLAVQQQLATNTGATTRNEPRPYLLRGVIYCANCGRKMRTSPERDRRVYRCSSRETPGGTCGGRRVPADVVESWAWEEIRAALQDPSIIAAEWERRRQEGPDAALLADRDATARTLALIERKQADMLRRYRESDNDAFPWELVEREIAHAEREKRDLRAHLAEIEAVIAQHDAAVSQLDALHTYCQRVAGNLATFDFEGKRLAIQALDIRVTAEGFEVDPDVWKIDGAIPVDMVGELSPSY